MNELGENVGLVVHYQAVHYQKVQENGAFIKIGCSQRERQEVAFYAVIVHNNNIKRIGAFLQR